MGRRRDQGWSQDLGRRRDLGWSQDLGRRRDLGWSQDRGRGDQGWSQDRGGDQGWSQDRGRGDQGGCGQRLIQAGGDGPIEGAISTLSNQCVNNNVSSRGQGGEGSKPPESAQKHHRATIKSRMLSGWTVLCPSPGVIRVFSAAGMGPTEPSLDRPRNAVFFNISAQHKTTDVSTQPCSSGAALYGRRAARGELGNGVGCDWSGGGGARRCAGRVRTDPPRLPSSEYAHSPTRVGSRLEKYNRPTRCCQTQGVSPHLPGSGTANNFDSLKRLSNFIKSP